MLVGKSLKSSLPTYSRGFKKLPRLHYQPEKGVAPVFSPYAGNLMYSYVHKSMCKKYNLLIEGMNYCLLRIKMPE
ncbi:hypothetical protein M1146_05145, partial [Patescibacteria group bacterium]|nr:hypothetical protein [Patescibacteria group bacterium]